MPCTGCGACCQNIVIGSTRRSIVRDAALALAGNLGLMRVAGDSSSAFIYTHWHVSGRNARGQEVYQCDAYDAETRRCTVHDERPPVCREFPFYGAQFGSMFDVVLGETKRYPECGYVAEALVEMAIGG